MKPARNLPRSPLTAAQRLALALGFKKPGAFNCHIVNTPANVKRATGVFGSV